MATKSDKQTVAEAANVGFDELGLDTNTAADDPARTGVPRDERHDSIDRHTGTLTDEARELRKDRAG